jgi:class 3 adenylate cyclase
MAEARVERRLAEILAADIAGYSRLMGTDEVGTLAALKAHRRDIVDPAIAQYHGRTIPLAVLWARILRVPCFDRRASECGQPTAGSRSVERLRTA